VQRTTTVDLLTQLDLRPRILNKHIDNLKDTSLASNFKRCPEIDSRRIRVDTLGIEQVLRHFHITRGAGCVQAVESLGAQLIQINLLLDSFGLFVVLLAVEQFVLA